MRIECGFREFINDILWSYANPASLAEAEDSFLRAKSDLLDMNVNHHLDIISVDKFFDSLSETLNCTCPQRQPLICGWLRDA